MGSRLISSHRFSDAAVRVWPSRLTFVVDASIGGHGGGVDFAAGSAATQRLDVDWEHCRRSGELVHAAKHLSRQP